MPSEPSFDCRATAALLRSGASIAMAGHAAAVMSVLSISSALKLCPLLVWCVVVYLAVRVKMDAAFFELLADHPAEQLDSWLDSAGLRKNTGPRTIEQRRRGALRLWRALVAAVAIEIVSMLLGILYP